MGAQAQLLAERTAKLQEQERAQARLACRDSLLQQLGTEREEALKQLAASEARIAKADAEAALLREHVFASEARLQESESEMLRNLGDARQLAAVLESTSLESHVAASPGAQRLSVALSDSPPSREAGLVDCDRAANTSRQVLESRQARTIRRAPPISLPAPDAGTAFGDTQL